MLDQLIDAVVQNNAVEVQKFLDQGVNPNACLDEANITPLHFAAQSNAIQVIPVLINAGADVYAATSDDEQIPYDVAQMSGNNDAAKVLLGYMDQGSSHWTN